MRNKIIYFLVVIIVLSIMPFNGANAFKFNKNFLISDSDFADFTSMSLKDIESFLQNNGSFLAEYEENGKSAAEIIYNAAQKYKISPKVILVTMQKEEGIVTMPSYNDHAVKLAMGYHSPSSFTDQVNGGTKLLRDGFDFLAEQYGWKVGKPHKSEDNPKYVDNTVVPENRATASLYLYTPYIGGYYTDSGSYIGGNYIFVKIYARWFGESKNFTVEFIPSAAIYYIPEGNSSSIILSIKNTGAKTIKKGAILTALTTTPLIDIESVEMEEDLPPEGAVSLSVRIPPIGEAETVNFGVIDENGNILSKPCSIKILPVKLEADIEMMDNNLNISVKNSFLNVPFAYLTARIGFTGGSTKDYWILKGSSFQKNVTMEKTILLQNLELKSISLYFSGSNFQTQKHLETLFFKKEFEVKKYNLTLQTVPEDAYISIDSKFVGLSPITVTVQQGPHSIEIEKEGFKKLSVTKDISEDTTLSFTLLPEDNKPEIVFLNTLHLTNNPDFTLKGKVIGKVGFKNVLVNGKVVPLTGDNSFSCELTLAEGKNVIAVCDKSKLVQSSYTVILDSTPPEILVNDIPEVTKDMFIKVAVSANGADELLINNTSCENTVCTRFIKLQEGANKIAIVAKDKAGNVAKKEISITYAPPPAKILSLFIGKKIIYINGFKKDIDVAPEILHNRTMLPIRHVIEALGGKISYDASDRSVHIEINGAEITLTIGNNTALVNNMEKQIDTDEQVVPFIKNGRTFLPLRFIMESIGSSVKWIPDKKEVLILYPSP
jgi:hypothetical protein